MSGLEYEQLIFSGDDEIKAISSPGETAGRARFNACGYFPGLGIDATDLSSEGEGEESRAVSVEEKIVHSGWQRKGAKHGSGASVEDYHPTAALLSVRKQLAIFRRPQLQAVRGGESRGKLEPGALGGMLQVHDGYGGSRRSDFVIGFEQAEVRDVRGASVGSHFDFMRPSAYRNDALVRRIASRKGDDFAGALLNDSHRLRGERKRQQPCDRETRHSHGCVISRWMRAKALT